jgi:hypothetical protein
MNKTSDDVLEPDVLERARVREVTGVFHSRKALEDAVEDLLLAGFDRADIDRVASLDQVYRRLVGVYVAPKELADVARVPREPAFKWDDFDVTRICTVGIAAFAAAAPAASPSLPPAGVARQPHWLPDLRQPLREASRRW